MKERTTASKFSVSLPADLSRFLEQYQKAHGVSRSEAVAKGLEKLKEQELANAYKEHAEAWRRAPERAFWGAAVVDDGIDSDGW